MTACGPGAAQDVGRGDSLRPSPDQSALPGGRRSIPSPPLATTPIVPPNAGVSERPDHHPDWSVGPGAGHLEAVERGEIQRVAAVQVARTDGIRGIVNYASQPNPEPTFNAHQAGDMGDGLSTSWRLYVGSLTIPGVRLPTGEQHWRVETITGNPLWNVLRITA
jgi:hypothetical protein